MVQWEENLLKPLTGVTYDIRNSIFNQWYRARFSIDNNLDCSAKQNMSLESKGMLIFLTEAINILIQSAFLRKIWWECAKLSKKYESLCVDLSVLVYFYLQEIYQLQIKTNSPKTIYHLTIFFKYLLQRYGYQGKKTDLASVHSSASYVYFPRQIIYSYVLKSTKWSFFM